MKPRASLYLGAVLLLSLGALLLLPGCACWGAQSKQKAECVVVDHVIDCTSDAVMQLVPKVYDLVAFLLGGANGDPRWESYLESLEVMGLDVVACTAQAVADDLTKKAAGLPDPEEPGTFSSNGASAAELLTKLHTTNTAFQRWRDDRLPPGTKIKR